MTLIPHLRCVSRRKSAGYSNGKEVTFGVMIGIDGSGKVKRSGNGKQKCNGHGKQKSPGDGK